MHDRLLQLQRDIYLYETREFVPGEKGVFSVDNSAMLYFFPVGGFFAISFYGVGHDHDYHVKMRDLGYDYNFAFGCLLDLLCEQENAEKVIALTFDGPDEGANGTNGWDFNRIINSGVTFPNLESFKVKLTDIGDHNQSIIDSGGTMNEDGMIARLLRKMPDLTTLAVPSAPDKSFFEIGRHPLRELVVQAGYSQQGFIENLAESDNFYQLQALDFSDLHDMYDGIPEHDFVDFEAYKKLFESSVFSSYKHFHFTLRNAALSREQLLELQKISSIQFKYIEKAKSRYASHLLR